LVVRDQQGQLGLTCPTCRQVTPIPDRGVSGLQSAFLVNRLLEIQASSQNPAATLEEAAATDEPPSCKQANCFVHEGKELELYCETCGELICTRCALKGGEHQDHCYEELEKAFVNYQTEVSSLLEPLEERVSTIIKALARLDAHCGKISDQRAATAVNIHTTFTRLRDALDVRETELISQLDQTTQRKLKGLAAQKDQIEITLAQLHSCLHFMRESIKTADKADVLMMRKNTIHQAKELTTPFQPDTLEPIIEADIAFSVSADMIAVCRNYGQMSTSSDPLKCEVDIPREVVTAGEKCTTFLRAVDFQGEPCQFVTESLDCDFVSEISSMRIPCSVERRAKQHQYDITYQPTILGKHHLHIKVEGQHIRGSPFDITALKKMDTPTVIIDGVEATGIAVNSDSEAVVVAELNKDRVSMFSPRGKKLRSVHIEGARGVAMDSEGNVLVSCRTNRIHKLTSKLKSSMVVGTTGNGPLQFNYPIDIAVGEKVYVADSGNHRIQVLNSDLAFSYMFGKKGSGMGQFDCPWGIACDSTGKVYVADTYNNRIQVFTTEGTFLMVFGGAGVLRRPINVFIGTNDIVYVCEESNHFVSVFTSEGLFQTSLGKKGYGPGEFTHLRRLIMNCSGLVYACDRCTASGRIQIF
jgi:tripartite motif-containing protein 2/3/tripartite motif-containing protein 71